MRSRLRTRVEAPSARTSRTMHGMVRRTPARRRLVVAVVAAACGATRRRRRRSGPTRPSDVGDRRAATGTADHRPPTTRADRQRPRCPPTTEADDGTDARVAGVRRAARRPPSSRCPSTTTTPTGRRSSCSSPAASPTTRRTRSARCSSTRAARASAAPSSPPAPSSVYGEELLERFDIVGWDPRGTGYSEPAIDCIDDYDEYYAGTDITPDDDAERQEIVDLAEEFTDALRREQRRHPPARRHEQLAPATWTRSAGRSARTRSATSGSATAASSARTWATLFPETVRAAVLDGAADPNADPLESSLQQTAGFEAHADDRTSPQCSADHECAFHNDGDAEGAFDALMAELDENPIPSEPGRPDVNLGGRPAGGRRGDVLRRLVGAAVGGAGRRPGRRRRAACSRCTTRTTSASPTARGATSSRRSRRSAAWTRSSADGRGGRRHAPAVQRGRAPVLAGHHGRVLLHVLPAERSSRGSRSPVPAPGRSS